MIAKTTTRAAHNLVTHKVEVFPTSLGWVGLVWQGKALAFLTFGHATPPNRELAMYGEPEFGIRSLRWHGLIRDRIEKYAAGDPVDFSDVELARPPQTPFARRVILLCRNIPFGKTLTYAELAAKAGSPRASRAVGNVMRTNRVPLIVPCHRVVGARGALGGYSASDGVRMKERLLALESGGANKKI